MTVNRPDDLKTTFKKRGIKSRANNDTSLKFVGAQAGSTFADQIAVQAERIAAGSSDAAAFGEFYSSGVYEDTPGGERLYEEIYGDTDWTVVAQDPDAKTALVETFGDTGNDPVKEGGVLTEEELKQIYGSSTSAKNVASIKERQGDLYRAQLTATPTRDEDTKGIRGVEELDAPIDPIA